MDNKELLDEGVIDDNNTESIDTTEIEDNQGDDQETDDGDVETVPLKTFLDLKNKFKDSRKELADLRAKQYDIDSRDFISKKAKEYTDLGYDEALAIKLAEDLNSIRSEYKNNIGDEQSIEILDEIKDLKYEHKDIELYKDDIIRKIKNIRKKGLDLDVEDAYYIVSKDSRRVPKSVSDKDKLINKQQADILKNPKQGSNITTGNGSSTLKSNFKLDASDLKALKQLQAMQPNNNWTPEKYHKIMKS